jgi:hypothetical protein
MVAARTTDEVEPRGATAASSGIIDHSTATIERTQLSLLEVTTLRWRERNPECPREGARARALHLNRHDRTHLPIG